MPDVSSAPVTRHGGVGMLRRSAALPRFIHQSLVVLLRGLELVGADHALSRIVAIAVAPRRGRWRLVADHAAAPLLLETIGTVAAKVPLVGPQLAIGVEVLRREDVDLQR